MLSLVANPTHRENTHRVCVRHVQMPTQQVFVQSADCCYYILSYTQTSVVRKRLCVLGGRTNIHYLDLCLRDGVTIKTLWSKLISLAEHIGLQITEYSNR